MKIKRITAFILAAFFTLGLSAAAKDGDVNGTSFTYEEIMSMYGIDILSPDRSPKNGQADKFSEKYPYYVSEEEFERIIEKMLEKSLAEADGIPFGSDEKDGLYYISFLLYIDSDAGISGNPVAFTEAKAEFEGKEYPCYIFRSRSLVPAEAFAALGCKVEFNEDEYILTISKDDRMVEIMPHLLGMRANGADGEWVPLPICARYFGDELYVPARAVAKAMDFEIEWDNEARCTVLHE